MSPQNYPLPNTAFSPVNPAAVGMPNPPLPLGAHSVPYPQGHGQFQNNAGLVPQRQVSAVSQISMQPEGHQPNHTISPMSHTLSGQQSHNTSPSPQNMPDRTVSPEPQPANQSLAPPPVTTPRSSRQVEDDNIYDATPRQSFMPQNRAQVAIQSSPIKREQPPVQPVSEPSSPTPPPANLADAANSSGEPNGTGSTSTNEPPAPSPPVTHINGKPITSSADIFNQEKRKMLIREQEEKIPVFPTEPDIDMAAVAAAAAKKKKEAESEMPQMSATSYPGQEWNPYGDGGFDGGDSD
ncbi:hypothetical protein QBC37DRAFT_280821 [Rhypophila decipiens]|uniref:Uncharacterized protein n=1 Tax=Rhypophila decipiens TaxID=261697 RepID=A0AAN7B7Q5_9PEZI|nr:hypothetical protein QBC37DRAFT_280821 [Rhypophila decipiens]